MSVTSGIVPPIWPSLRAEQISAWHGHVSFGHWLVQATEPRVVVELGTATGVSFASFCNSAARNSHPARCFAVDTWAGDAHTGPYSDRVFDNLNDFVKKNFPTSATLLRCYFDDALKQFDDGTVDLLHIDGLHTYDAVKYDFETWLPKLSNHGVVLFHDTEIRHKDFGVWQFWEQVTKIYPHFSFRHSAGLGVLAIGAAMTEGLYKLCALSGDRAINEVRDSFIQASAIARSTGIESVETARNATLNAMIAGRKNIALNRKAHQSSGSANLGGADPQGAVNGMRTGRFGFHTKREEHPWWMVDLGPGAQFDEIFVYNRLDGPCPERARALCVLLSDDGQNWKETYHHDGSVFGGADGNPLIITCPGSQARYVKLQLAETQFLHLDQIEIYRTLRE